MNGRSRSRDPRKIPILVCEEAGERFTTCRSGQVVITWGVRKGRARGPAHGRADVLRVGFPVAVPELFPEPPLPLVGTASITVSKPRIAL